MCDFCNGEAKLFGSHDYECSDKATGDVKAVMNVDAAVIPDRKALEINVGINNTIIFLHEMGIEYCPKCGRELQYKVIVEYSQKPAVCNQLAFLSLAYEKMFKKGIVSAIFVPTHIFIILRLPIPKIGFAP